MGVQESVIRVAADRRGWGCGCHLGGEVRNYNDLSAPRGTRGDLGGRRILLRGSGADKERTGRSERRQAGKSF